MMITSFLTPSHSPHPIEPSGHGSKKLQKKPNSIVIDIMTMVFKYCTAKLWIKYMEIINIMQNFIRSERTGDSLLHFQTMTERLPYLVTYGHILYTKSLKIYLQWMTNLPEIHSLFYMQFNQELHVIRRSD